MACIDIPEFPGLQPIRNDRTAGFADGVESARQWLLSLPEDFHGRPFNVRDAADILGDMLELVNN